MDNSSKVKKFIKNYHLIKRDNSNGWRRRAFKEFMKEYDEMNIDKRLERITNKIENDIERIKGLNISNKLIKITIGGANE